MSNCFLRRYCNYIQLHLLSLLRIYNINLLHQIFGETQVVFLLLSTIIGPQLLGAARVYNNLPDTFKNNFVLKSLMALLLVIFAPFIMFIQKLRLTYLSMKIEANPRNDFAAQEWIEAKRELYNHIKLELGLETIYQLAGQLILLALAITETPTNEGLKTVFMDCGGQIEDSNFGFVDKAFQNILESIGIERCELSKVLLIISIAFSFICCLTSHLSALSACREHFPNFCSKIVAIFYSLFSCTTRVMAIVLFFAVPLGLFSLLKHWQGEQIAWNARFVMNYVEDDGTIDVGSIGAIPWKPFDRWEKNDSKPSFDGNFLNIGTRGSHWTTINEREERTYR